MRHNPDRGIMPQFVQGRAMPVDGFEIGLRRRDHDEIGPRRVEGAVAADTEVDAGCADERLDSGLDQSGRRRRRSNGNVIGEVFALGGVEHREPLQERDRLGFLAGFTCAAFFIVGHEAVSVDDGRAVLALADIAA
jgi:hypothetical protein